MSPPPRAFCVYGHVLSPTHKDPPEQPRANAVRLSRPPPPPPKHQTPHRPTHTCRPSSPPSPRIMPLGRSHAKAGGPHGTEPTSFPSPSWTPSKRCCRVHASTPQPNPFVVRRGPGGQVLPGACRKREGRTRRRAHAHPSSVCVWWCLPRPQQHHHSSSPKASFGS